jgi:hypothetical protein
MLSSIEFKILESRGFISNLNRARYISRFGFVTAFFGGSSFVIEKPLFEKIKKYKEFSMVLLESNNEFSIGIAKLILIENKIPFNYHSNGYEISKKDFYDNKEKFDSVLSLKARYL